MLQIWQTREEQEHAAKKLREQGFTVETDIIVLRAGNTYVQMDASDELLAMYEAHNAIIRYRVHILADVRNKY